MTIAEFVRSLGFEDLPSAVVNQARRCLLDLLGVAAGGRRTEVTRIVTNHAVRQFGSGTAQGARMLFDGRRVSPAGAAAAGAWTIDALDAHDGHVLTKGHAGVAVLPALLAFADAESLALDDRELLTCLVVGYEIATRAGIALHASACDYHTSGAWNALACAALGARLLKLTPEQTREALGTAEFYAPRSQMMRCIDHPTMVKDGSGWGALAGVSAAYLAADGFTGAPAVTMEAEDLRPIWSDLGETWRITEQYFKPYPVCRWAQPAMEAARHVMAAHHLRGSDIADVEVRTFAEGVRLATVRPGSSDAAQYSLPFSLAALILRGKLGADEIAGDGLRDAAVLDLAARIRLVEDPDICARFPAERFAAVTLATHDGRTLRSDWTKARGGSRDPLADEELTGKFRQLTAHLGPARRSRIEEAVSGLGRGAPAPAAPLLDLIFAPL